MKRSSRQGPRYTDIENGMSRYGRLRPDGVFFTGDLVTGQHL